jgi:3-methyl-2-oxobutanoate hydroxymethyltransferase
MLGIYDDQRTLRHAKRYAVVGATIRDAVREYIAEVEGGEFPAKEHGFDMSEETLRELAGVG